MSGRKRKAPPHTKQSCGAAPVCMAATWCRGQSMRTAFDTFSMSIRASQMRFVSVVS